MSLQALEARRKAEAQMVAAKTEEEKRKIMADQKLHRVHLTFAGDEAELVKRVLGDEPAKRLVDLCRQFDTVGKP